MTSGNNGRVSTGTIQKYAKSITRGVYEVPEEDLQKILLKMQQGEELDALDWQDLSNAFFDKIYKDIAEDLFDAVFVEAVKIRRSEKLSQTAKSQAMALIKLYKDNIK